MDEKKAREIAHLVFNSEKAGKAEEEIARLLIAQDIALTDARLYVREVLEAGSAAIDFVLSEAVGSPEEAQKYQTLCDRSMLSSIAAEISFAEISEMAKAINQEST